VSAVKQGLLLRLILANSWTGSAPRSIRTSSDMIPDRSLKFLLLYSNSSEFCRTSLGGPKSILIRCGEIASGATREGRSASRSRVNPPRLRWRLPMPRPSGAMFWREASDNFIVNSPPSAAVRVAGQGLCMTADKGRMLSLVLLAPCRGLRIGLRWCLSPSFTLLSLSVYIAAFVVVTVQATRATFRERDFIECLD